MPDITDTKDKQFSLDCQETVHVVKFSQLEYLTDLLAIGTTGQLSVVRCIVKVFAAICLLSCINFLNTVHEHFRFNFRLMSCLCLPLG